MMVMMKQATIHPPIYARYVFVYSIYILYTLTLASFTLHYSHKIRTKTHAHNEHRRVGTHSNQFLCVSVCIFSSWYISLQTKAESHITRTTTCIFRVDSVFSHTNFHTLIYYFEILLCLFVCLFVSSLHTLIWKIPIWLLQVKNRWKQTNPSCFGCKRQK